MLDRRSLLLTDARIIAEDETYIAVSIRIPKRVLHANIPFISHALEASLDRTVRRRVPLAVRVFCAALMSPAAMLLNWILTLYFGAT